MAWALSLTKNVSIFDTKPTEGREGGNARLHTLSFLGGAAFAPSATAGLLPLPPVISIAVVCIELPV
jgi:hypothetical protein